MICTMTIPAADWHRVYTLPVYVEHLLQAFFKKRGLKWVTKIRNCYFCLDSLLFRIVSRGNEQMLVI